MANRIVSDRQKRLEAIRARVTAVDTSSGSGQNWFTPKAGTNKIRIMPEVGEMTVGSFFQEVGRHYIPSGLDTDGNPKFNIVTCPAFTIGEPCPICETVDKLYRGGKADKQLAGKLRVRKAYFMNVIDRDNEDVGPQVFSSGVTIFKAIVDAITDPDYGDITDEYDGLDVTITRNGTGMDTKYQVRFARVSTPLAGTAKKPNEELMDTWFEAAVDLSPVMLTDDPDEDDELSGGALVLVHPYSRIAADFDMDSTFGEEEEEEEEEVVQRKSPTPRTRTTRRASR